MIERIRHYFSVYKWAPDEDSPVSVSEAYNFERAAQEIKASIQDYEEMYGG